MSAEALRWVERHRGGAAPADVLAFADRLPGVPVEEMTGRWRGAELPAALAGFELPMAKGPAARSLRSRLAAPMHRMGRALGST